MRSGVPRMQRYVFLFTGILTGFILGLLAVCVIALPYLFYTGFLIGDIHPPRYLLIPLAIAGVGVMSACVWSAIGTARHLYAKWSAQGRSIVAILGSYYALLALLQLGMCASAYMIREKYQQDAVERAQRGQHDCALLASLPVISGHTAQLSPDRQTIDVGVTFNGARPGKYELALVVDEMAADHEIHRVHQDMQLTNFPFTAAMQVPAAPVLEQWKKRYSGKVGICSPIELTLILRPYFGDGEASRYIASCADHIAPWSQDIRAAAVDREEKNVQWLQHVEVQLPHEIDVCSNGTAFQVFGGN